MVPDLRLPRFESTQKSNHLFPAFPQMPSLSGLENVIAACSSLSHLSSLELHWAESGKEESPQIDMGAQLTVH
jgi:hypothetical protein